jgi:hypothetical protein
MKNNKSLEILPFKAIRHKAARRGWCFLHQPHGYKALYNFDIDTWYFLIHHRD